MCHTGTLGMEDLLAAVMLPQVRVSAFSLVVKRFQVGSAPSDTESEAVEPVAVAATSDVPWPKVMPRKARRRRVK